LVDRASIMRLVIALAVLSWPVGIAAQEAQRIAAVVNDEVISTYDLAERVELVVRTTGLDDTQEARARIRPQVLRALIDERLQIQEAKRLGVEIEQADVDGALRFLERQNNIPEGKMLEALASRGVPPETLIEQLEAELKWSRLVQARVRRTVTITDVDIDEVMSRLAASQGKPEIRLAEIYLAVDDPSQAAEVAAAAQRLVEDIRGGANFGALARQFSQSASARGGGELGWTPVDQLADDVRQAVETAAEGSLVGPLATRGGYAILAVAGRRSSGEADPGDTRLDLELVALPLPTVATAEQEAEQMARATEAAGRITGCDDAETVAEATPTARHRVLGEVRLGNAAPELRKALADLKPGQVSPPITAGGIINVLVVCDRQEAETEAPNRDEVRDVLLNQRTELLSRGYLRDLRRSAFVDVRL
jgi:peptidyl-prolyl cis-trans isomerase SurA